MSTQLQIKSPLYDLFEGLGRRRRLRSLGIDPDQVVVKDAEVDCARPYAIRMDPLQKIAAE